MPPSTTLNSLAVEALTAVQPQPTKPLLSFASIVGDPHAAHSDADRPATESEAVPIHGVRPPRPGAIRMERLRTRTRGVISTAEVYGLMLHPDGLCRGRWGHTCPLCEAGVLPAWAGFVGFVREPLPKQQIDRQELLVISAEQLSDLDDYYQRHDTLRGARIYSVHGVRHGGAALVDLRPSMDWLPAALDLTAAIAMHFDVPERCTTPRTRAARSRGDEV